jgi:alkylation response protein AidB-like acyl-CoA dehydrogenase
MSDLESLRAEVRTFLEKETPVAIRGATLTSEQGYWGGRKAEQPHPESKRYCEIMASRGYTAPTWPKEYGGAGLSAAEAKVLDQELARLKLPLPLTGFGLAMIGPTLLQFGTEAQKQEHIPKIVRGEIRWCQGYSEPGAGSDLAAVATSARIDGDELVLNGQKVWTSYGDKSDWMFALVRTDANVKKQQGITFVLFDMAQPGVEVRPIRLISGASPFCETFFTDARAKQANIIAGMGNGWTVAKALLGHERNMIGSLFGSGGARSSADASKSRKNPLVDLAREHAGEHDGRIADPVLRDRVTQIGMDHRAFMLTVQRNADNLKAGHKPGPESSIFKIYGTELNQRREELMLSIRGPRALGWEASEAGAFAPEDLAQTRTWLRSRGNTIEGGTSEVQLNIIAKRVLELPD